MTYQLTFAKQALKVLKKWKKSDTQKFIKASAIFHELAEHPRTGLGHPEPLKGCGRAISQPMTVSSMTSTTAL